MDGWVEGWTDERPGQAGWRTRVGRPSWASKTSQDGRTGGGERTGRDGRTGTGCPSMNVARRRRPTNARSTKIRRSVTSP